MSEKYRVQFDFTSEAFDELERLKVSVGASSRAEVVRYALRILQWATDEVHRGGEILVRRGGETERVVFPFLTSANREINARAQAQAQAAQASPALTRR
jgi:hypothetical protein